MFCFKSFYFAVHIERCENSAYCQRNARNNCDWFPLDFFCCHVAPRYVFFFFLTFVLCGEVKARGVVAVVWRNGGVTLRPKKKPCIIMQGFNIVKVLCYAPIKAKNQPFFQCNSLRNGKSGIFAAISLPILARNGARSDGSTN